MGEIYQKGASRIDQCAHRLYDFMADYRVEWDTSRVVCPACGAEIETTYCEERLYIVRCDCIVDSAPIGMLIKARNPGDAAWIMLKARNL